MKLVRIQLRILCYGGMNDFVNPTMNAIDRVQKPGAVESFQASGHTTFVKGESAFVHTTEYMHGALVPYLLCFQSLQFCCKHPD